MRLSRAAIDRVPEQGVTYQAHVDPHLVGPSCFQAALDQRGISKNVQASPMGHRPFPPASFSQGNLLAVCRGAREGGVDRSVAGLRVT